MASDNSTVVYKNIPGFTGYRVGDDGSVWSCRRQVGLGDGGGTKTIISDTWKRMKCQRWGKYTFVTLLGKHTRPLHKIVLESFVGPCPPGMEACHNDGDRTNNAISNLRWGTHTENMQDRIKHRTIPIGEKHPNAIVTETEVAAIRLEYASGGVTQCQLAAKYHVSQPLVSSIIRRELWQHVK